MVLRKSQRKRSLASALSTMRPAAPASTARVVAAQLLELRDHVVGPVLRAGLPAVVDDVADALLAHLVGADRLLVAVEILLHVVLHVAAIHLVDFKAGGLGGGGMIRDAQQRIAEAQHDPIARRAASSPACRRGSSSTSGRRHRISQPLRRHHGRRGEMVEVAAPGTKAAFSSNWFTRAPACRTNSAIS